VLVLLMTGVSYVRRGDGLRWHDIQFRCSSNIKGNPITSTI
jgi:hypothetical protein